MGTARALGMRELWAAVGRENARAMAIVRAAGFEPGEASAIYRLERKLHQPLEDDRLVTLTRATPEMLDEALTVIRECAPDQPISRDDLWQMLHDPELSILLAGSEAGERIGVIAIDVRERWIVLLGVHESVRGRGFAGAMLSRALQEHWAEHPDVRLGMTVRIENVAAIGLYARQGFEPWVVVTRWSLTL
jgi:ribosomal protein S18 acetylase RimI-like enzyme